MVFFGFSCVNVYLLVYFVFLVCCGFSLRMGFFGVCLLVWFKWCVLFYVLLACVDLLFVFCHLRSR